MREVTIGQMRHGNVGSDIRENGGREISVSGEVELSDETAA